MRSALCPVGSCLQHPEHISTCTCHRWVSHTHQQECTLSQQIGLHQCSAVPHIFQKAGSCGIQQQSISPQAEAYHIEFYGPQSLRDPCCSEACTDLLECNHTAYFLQWTHDHPLIRNTLPNLHKGDRSSRSSNLVPAAAPKGESDRGISKGYLCLPVPVLCPLCLCPHYTDAAVAEPIAGPAKHLAGR